LQEQDADFFLLHKNSVRDAIEKNEELQDLRAGARSGMSLDAYLVLLGGKRTLFENICHV
jgi:hypothetical protein